jgi:hypothetical protein
MLQSDESGAVPLSNEDRERVQNCSVARVGDFARYRALDGSICSKVSARKFGFAGSRRSTVVSMRWDQVSAGLGEKTAEPACA